MENIIFAVLVLGAIAIVFGLILSVAAKVFEVKVDERLPKIQECLDDSFNDFINFNALLLLFCSK